MHHRLHFTSYRFAVPSSLTRYDAKLKIDLVHIRQTVEGNILSELGFLHDERGVCFFFVQVFSCLLKPNGAVIVGVKTIMCIYYMLIYKVQ
jgi:hypothetical protein